MNGKKIAVIGFLVVLMVAIPLTVYILQKQQETQSHATPATTLSFTPTTQTTSASQSASLDIMVNPGTNIVSVMTLSINYDQTKLSTSSANTCNTSFCTNSAAFPVIVDGPKYTPGNITVTLSTGADPTRFIQTITKIGTVTFQALPATAPTSAQVSFSDKTVIFSANTTNGQDTASENVLLLSSLQPATLNIVPAVTPLTPTPTSPPTTQTPNQPPACTALNVDRTTSGVAPFSIAFTAVGNDTDGTISKVTFNYGDGPVQDVTQTGGIGTNSVSVQIAHTYNNPGTYKATAVLTDSNGGVSNSTSCTQTITVTAGTGGGGSATATSTPTTIVLVPTATPTPTPVVNPTMPASGPGDKILGIGAVAAIFSIVGGLLFFAL